MHNPPRSAIILAGGRGTRLGCLTADTPKPMLPVGGRPFLEYVIWNLCRQGITDIVLSVGYLAEAIKSALGDGRFIPGLPSPVRLRYAVETTPLGTGGGARLAMESAHIDTGPVYVLNGDTLLDCRLASLAEATANARALAGICLRQVDDAGRFGAVTLESGIIRAFGEKCVHGPGLINGGVYLLTPQAMERLPAGPSSLETDLFPALARDGLLAGCVTHGFFLDMGLPETYQLAQKLLPRWQGNAGRPYVLLDRDGTVIVEKNYLHDPAEVELIPGAAQGLKALQDAGFGLALVTNQAGIGRGFYQEADMHAVNARLAELLAAHGVRLEHMYFCPHAPGDHCDCRKPRTGMGRKAVQELCFDPTAATVVGDKACDIDLGLAMGAASVLVLTGYGERERAAVEPRAQHVARSLAEAAQWIIDHRGNVA